MCCFNTEIILENKNMYILVHILEKNNSVATNFAPLILEEINISTKFCSWTFSKKVVVRGSQIKSPIWLLTHF